MTVRMENNPFTATFTYGTQGKPRVRGAIQSAIAEAQESHMDVLEVLSTERRSTKGQIGEQWSIDLLVKCADENSLGEPVW